MTRIVGIVNLTADSFSDGGRHLHPDAAIAHAERLLAEGADVVELGPASSHPDAEPVAAGEEVRRLGPVVAHLVARGVAVGVDSWQPATQRWALAHGVRWLNDIRGFPDPSVYPELAAADCRLVVMHAVGGGTRATRVAVDAGNIVARIGDFFAGRVAALAASGIARERLVLDPGMGYFLGAAPEPSLAVLRRLAHLKSRFALPLCVSVSRKSFLGALTGRDVHARGAATLAAELFAAAQGADWLRTHDVAALRDGLTVTQALKTPSHRRGRPRSAPGRR